MWDKEAVTVQHKTKNMKNMKFLIGLSLMMAFTSMVHAGKTGGTTTTTGGFTFQYTVDTVGYHAYGMAGQVGKITRPKGTLVLGQWYVWDLGAVSGVGKVTCPKPVTARGVTVSCLGLLFLASTADVGGQAFRYPSAQVEIFTPQYYNGYASIAIVQPDGTGAQLYWGLPFSPFAWDFTPLL
jgi:hypothetical protein